MGSSLKLCLVASGEAHMYPRVGPTCEWDTGAAHAVAIAAGATVTVLDVNNPLDKNAPPLQYLSLIHLGRSGRKGQAQYGRDKTQ